MRMISDQASTRDIIRSFANLTPEKVIRGKYPSMVRLKNEMGRDKTEQAVAILVLDASVAFGEEIDKDSALDLAAEIQTEYYYLTLEDCYVVLNRLKRQPIYGKLNLNKILTAFEQYNAERLQKAAEMNYNHHLAEKENPNADDRNVSLLKSPIKQARKQTKKRSK